MYTMFTHLSDFIYIYIYTHINTTYCVCLTSHLYVLYAWVWVKINPPGDRRFWSMFPLTRVPVGVPMFDPQPGFSEAVTWCKLFCEVLVIGNHSSGKSTFINRLLGKEAGGTPGGCGQNRFGIPCLG